jgi:hypothetical protein
MLASLHNTFVSWFIVLGVFVVVPAKILYHNTAALRPLARVPFALTAPVIFMVCMVGAFVTSTRFFDKWLPSYAPIADTLIALTLAVLVVLLWYRFLKRIAGFSVDKLERAPVENTKRRVAMSTEEATLKRRIQILDLTFWSMVALMVNAGVVHGSGHSVDACAISMLVYLIALGTLVSRLGKSWITCVGLSLTGIGLIVIFLWIRFYAGDYFRAAKGAI